MFSLNLKKTSVSLMFVVALVASAMILPVQTSQAQEYKVVTVIESIVASGLGRSRIIDYTGSGVDAGAYTTERIDGKKSSQSKVKRGSVKVDQFKETKLLNLFSLGGINLQNIASNDAVVSSKLSALSKEGWSLAFVTSAVESDGGKQDGQGIFITRYIFKK